MNWVSMTAKTLSTYEAVTSVVHIDVFKSSISFKELLTPNGLKRIIKQTSSLVFKKYTDYSFYSILPFSRFEASVKLNKIINLFFLGLILLVSRQPTVLISSYSCPDWLNPILKYINIMYVVADCTDIWPTKNIKYMAKISNVFCVNSLFMQRYVSQFTQKTKLISAGYFPERLIKRIARRKTLKNGVRKNIVLISSINWRVNFIFINTLLDKLPDYNFYLIGPDIFNYFKESHWSYRNTRVNKEWKKLRFRKNFVHIPIHNQDQLPNIRIDNAIGVITYDMNDRFNRYCHPIKLYQYFAFGFPVVSVPVPSLLNNPTATQLYFANTIDKFASQIKDLKLKRISKSDLSVMLKIATNQSYESKSSDFIDILEKST